MPPKVKMAAKRRAPAPKPKKRKAQKTPIKAKKIKIDPKTMLLKVIRLGEEMRKGGNKGKRLTLKELNIPNVCKEVDEMPPGMLQGHIEKVILETVNNILEGKGFSFTMPTRSSSNQLYVPELDRIVLKDKMITREFATVSNSKKVAITTKVLQLVYELCVRQIHTTKRDLFYTDVKLFEKQDNTDDVLDDVACMVGCTRSSLRVVASEKGIVVGRIIFDEAGDEIDCTKMGIGVEKDAAFQRLAEDRFYNTYPCIIITAKGQPDVATRHFLKKIKTELNIPVLGLVDADPYGLKILSVYMSGSKNMSYDSAHLTTPDIKWLGIRPTDLDKYGIPEQCRLSMTEHDIKTGKQLLKEDFIKKNPEWFKELEHMVRTKEKAEIQALSSFGFQYLTQVYLPQKIAQGDWI